MQKNRYLGTLALGHSPPFVHVDRMLPCSSQRSMSPRHRPSQRASSPVRRSDSRSRSSYHRRRPDVGDEAKPAWRSGSDSRAGSLTTDKRRWRRNSRSRSLPHRRHLNFSSTGRRGNDKHRARTFSRKGSVHCVGAPVVVGRTVRIRLTCSQPFSIPSSRGHGARMRRCRELSAVLTDSLFTI